MQTTGIQFMDGGDKIAPLECVTKYEDVGHEIVVRELTQNALDAARAAGQDRCELRIEMRTVPTDQIPGIETYREHLSPDYMQAWESKGQRKYTEAIENFRRLARAPETECLVVYDNGIGLDAHTMEGLIGKGDTMKKEDDGGSAGTHGVGHETAFAAGDMASGHVVFPTHYIQSETRNERYGGHGYLTHDANQISLSGVAVIEDKTQIPPLIQAQLDHVSQFDKGQPGTGSVVTVPAFNRFPESDGEPNPNCCDQICEDIAKHYFVAIAQGRLRVSVQDYVNNRGGGVNPPVCRIQRT